MRFIFRRKLLTSALFVLLALALPLSVGASDCVNLSRGAGNVDNTSGLVVRGNWLWLGTFGFDAWLFLPPGSAIALDFSAAGVSGNYTAARTDHLLGLSAICTKQLFTDPTTDPRQMEHGIQNDCVPFPQQ